MSALPQDDTRVVCVSCRYRYSSARGFCPICGAAAPADFGTQGLHEVSKPTRPDGDGEFDSRGRSASKWILRFTVPIAILAVVLVCAWYVVGSRDGTAPATTSPKLSTATPAPAPPPAMEIESTEAERAAPRSATARPVTGGPANSAVAPDDPAELWKRVGHGDTTAEVTLAKLYLEGTGVSQSCEQARLLLTAAAEKRQPEAVRLLSGEYTQRCQ